MKQNYVTNMTKVLSPLYYIKVKTVGNSYKAILYHKNSTNTNISIVFCLTFPTLEEAVTFAAKFDMGRGHM